MKRILKQAFAVAGVLLLSTSLAANGLNLNSVGSKAIGMGGAFVGLADDYSAIFWNPAGMIKQEGPIFSLYGSAIMPHGTYEFAMAGINTETESKAYPSGAIGYIKPLSDKVVVGILGYVPSGSGATWPGADLTPLSSGIVLEWESMVGIIALSPAVAVRVTDQLTLGAALNIYYGLLKIKRPGLVQYEEDLTGMAVGGTISAMFQPSEMLSFGLTFKTPISVKMKGDATMSGAGILGLSVTSDAERSADWPMWIGFGVAVKPMDRLTITADLQYTDWKKLTDIPVTYENLAWQAAFAKAGKFELQWESKIQWRFGMEYRLNDIWALRAGYYYDPAPGPLETANILLPQFTYNWATVGVGYHTDSISLDVAVEFGFGEDREVPVGLKHGMPGIHGMSMVVPNIAFTYRF
ncbi:MAG TPA: hypothetical protein ENN40_02185 [Candidatus Aminicenantes bacterium]|nr:hypothetical protein [Candidatus Aminicenantes bacterium]